MPTLAAQGGIKAHTYIPTYIKLVSAYTKLQLHLLQQTIVQSQSHQYSPDCSSKLL
jgi:hypothetical protein